LPTREISISNPQHTRTLPIPEWVWVLPTIVGVRSLLHEGSSSASLCALFRATVPKKKGNPGAGRDAAHQCEPLDARVEREAVPPHPSIHRFRAVTSPTTASNPGRKTRVQLVAVASSAVEDEVYSATGLQLMTETFRHHACGILTLHGSRLPVPWNWNTHASTTCRWNTVSLSENFK
jgi:hypothetical protein